MKVIELISNFLSVFLLPKADRVTTIWKVSSHTRLHLIIVVKNARPGVLNILHLVQFSLYFWNANDYGDFMGLKFCCGSSFTVCVLSNMLTSPKPKAIEISPA